MTNNDPDTTNDGDDLDDVDDELYEDRTEEGEFDEGSFLYPPGSDPEDEEDGEVDEGEDGADDWDDNPFDGPGTPEY